jgi:hypothetical protein
MHSTLPMYVFSVYSTVLLLLKLMTCLTIVEILFGHLCSSLGCFTLHDKHIFKKDWFQSSVIICNAEYTKKALNHKKGGSSARGPATRVGSWEGINRGKPSARKGGEAAYNPWPGDSVRQLSSLHQACPFKVLNHREGKLWAQNKKQTENRQKRHYSTN